jgi:hypothetical protein
MPFTTNEIIRKHILDHHVGSSLVSDERVYLTGTDNCRLQNRTVLQSSDIVKAREQGQPIMEAVSFELGDTFSLAHEQLVPESVVVAGDSSLGQIYVENVDYHIDYRSGIINRIGTGSIPQSGERTIWYLYYRIYQRGVDYDIDYQRGTIRRRTSGAIEPGQRVLVDYTTEFSALDDATIDNAINEADEQVVAFIGQSYRNSSDKALVIAETYLAIAIICRIRAMEAMAPGGAVTGNSNDARSWAAIADMYRKEAYDFLSPYSASAGTLKAPDKA